MKMTTDNRLPRPARVLIATVVAIGAAAVAVRLPELSSWSTTDLWAFAALLAITVVGEQAALRIRFGRETKGITLTEAAFVVALLQGMRPSVLTVSVALGVTLAHTARGTAAHKTIFNVGSWAAAVTAAELVYVSLNGVSPLAAVTLAMGAFFAVNAGTVLPVIALATGESVVRIAGSIARVEIVQSIGNIGAGLAIAAVWATAPAALPVLVVVPAACFAAYRSLASRRPALAGR